MRKGMAVLRDRRARPGGRVLERRRREGGHRPHRAGGEQEGHDHHRAEGRHQRRGPRREGLEAGRPVARRPGPAGGGPQDLRGRADRGEAGPEQHRLPGRQGPEAGRERLDRPHGAEPPSRGRHGAAGRRDPPAPRRVAQPEPQGHDHGPASPSGSWPPARRRRSSPRPTGYGYRYKKTDNWLINYMLHNLWPKGEKIWITYDVDFIPDTAPAGEGHQGGHARSGWTCRTAAPTRSSTCSRARARTASTPTPTTPTSPYGDGPPENRVDRRRPTARCVATGGHLHPGGLHDRPVGQRAGATGAPTVTTKEGRADTAHLFTSVANYYEPAGRGVVGRVDVRDAGD